MYTIKINQDEPITCTDYGIHNKSGEKVLYMSFDDQADVGIKLDEKTEVHVKFNE